MGERPWSWASSFAALVAVAGLGATACTSGIAGHEERTSSVSSAVVAGSPSSTAEDAVVLVVDIAQNAACTGTLLTPNLVLTARHCVSTLDPSTYCSAILSNTAPSALYIQIGVAADGNDPTAWAVNVFYGPSDDPLCGNDVALLQLDHDLTGAPTMPVRFAPPAAGETAMLIGYGYDATGHPTAGRYQRGGVSVLAVGAATYPWPLANGGTENIDLRAGTFLGSEAACHGDSGAPLVDAAGNIFGTDSTDGLQEDICAGAPTIYTSLAQHEQLIRGAAASAGHPLPTAAPSTARALRAAKSTPSTAGPPSTLPTSPTDDPSDAAPLASAGCSATPRVASSANGSLVLALAFAFAFAFVRRQRRSWGGQPGSGDLRQSPPRR